LLDASALHIGVVLVLLLVGAVAKRSPDHRV
jgi:hypothetical protein